MPPIKPFAPIARYEKPERPPATDQNPTMGALLGSRDRGDWVKVKFPRATPFFDTEGRAITHQAIWLNKQPYEPGQEYTLPPVVAAELRTAIRNSTEGIALQMQKRNKANIAPYATQGETGAMEIVEDFESMFDQAEQVV